ncbi:MAG: hypothetical protein WCP08_12575 [Prolixibacteraceae bacterium]
MTICFLLFTISAFGLNTNLNEIPKDGFWGMKGKIVIYPFADKIDSLSGQEIYELRNEKELPIWFCREFYKQVCLTGQCKIIHLWLFWDGAGNYLGIQVFKDEELTKLEHGKFEPADYVKLDAILKDSTSMLKTSKYETLTEEVKIKSNFQVDAYSGATKPSILQEVVAGAAYTCFTLWHTVYGATQVEVSKIISERMSQSYLALLFESADPSFISLAIRSVEKNSKYHLHFYPQIILAIQSDRLSLSKLALDYFQPDRLVSVDVQKKILALDVSPQRRYDIIWQFTKLQKIDNDIITTILEMYKKHALIDGSLILILDLIRKDHLKDKRVIKLLGYIEEHEGVYNKNIIHNLLQRL